MQVEQSATSIDENINLLDNEELDQESEDNTVSMVWLEKVKPLAILFAICTFAVLLWSVWNYLNTRIGLPNIKGQHEFRLANVENVLRNITQRPHMYNSDENLKVRGYLLQELYSIAGNSSLPIEIWSNDSTNVVINNNFYESLNIVVRIRGNASRNSSLLVSAHYDSTSLSLGVTDDGIAVAVILETIRLIGNSKIPKMDIVFNINNGEEMGLLGGYAFLLHPWFKNIKAFINLEGTGSASGTRSILFRTNSFEVAKLAESAPYPHASIIFNTLMKYVKSDTDYRPYAGIAGLPGMDIAFYSYRYLYHTPHDSMEHYKSESALQMGLNLLGMVRKAIDAPEWLQKLPPVHKEKDPLGVLSIPDFVYYDLYGYYFVIFKGLSFRTWQGVLILACVLFAIGSFLINYINEGSNLVLEEKLKPFLSEFCLVIFSFFLALFLCFFLSLTKWLFNPSASYGQYKLNIVCITAAVVAAFSLSCIFWPEIERILGLTGTNYQPIVLPSSLSDEDFLPSPAIPSKPDHLFIHRGLLGFWCSLLTLSWILAMAVNFSSLYFVFDWTFSSLISIVILYNLPSLIEMDLETMTETSTAFEGFWNSSRRILLSNIWMIGLVISTSLPSLMTMDIIMEMMIGLPSLIAEGLSSLVVDMAFSFLIIVLFINILPGIYNNKPIIFLVLSCATLVPSFLALLWITPFSVNTPQKFMFTHTWDITLNISRVELMVAPTMNSPDFIKVSRIWMDDLAIPSCTPHADKRDSTSCIYSVPHPVLKGRLSSFDPSSLITLHWKKERLNNNLIAAKWQGSPESRICSVQVFRSNSDPISIELDMDSNQEWSSIKGFPGPFLNLSEPIFLMRRSFGASHRIESTLGIRGSISGIEKLQIRCYHSEVAGNISSDFFDELDVKKPKWTSFHHGRMGGIIVERTFMIQQVENE